jgi:hypothetical protein
MALIPFRWAVRAKGEGYFESKAIVRAIRTIALAADCNCSGSFSP